MEYRVKISRGGWPCILPAQFHHLHINRSLFSLKDTPWQIYGSSKLKVSTAFNLEILILNCSVYCYLTYSDVREKQTSWYWGYNPLTSNSSHVPDRAHTHVALMWSHAWVCCTLSKTQVNVSKAFKSCSADKLRQGYRSTFMRHIKNMFLHDISFLLHME